MLVLKRKVGETLVIGDVEVTIIKVHDSKSVRLGVSAPESVPILRKEIQDRKLIQEAIAHEKELDAEGRWES